MYNFIIDDDNHSKIFIFEKNLYCIRYNVNKHYYYNDYDNDYDDDDFDDDDFNYHNDFIVNYYDILLYNNNNNNNNSNNNNNNNNNKPLNDFERLVSVKNNTVNSINNDNHKRNITLLVDNFRVFICENVYQIDGNGILLNYKLFTKQKHIITLCVPK